MPSRGDRALDEPVESRDVRRIRMPDDDAAPRCERLDHRFAGLEPEDLEGLATRSVLDLAKKLDEDRGFSPAVFLERLNMVEAHLVTGIASEKEAHVHDAESCARIIRRLRCEREHTALQREIDRLQELGAVQHGDEINALWARKRDLLHEGSDLLELPRGQRLQQAISRTCHLIVDLSSAIPG